jgi:hypothetical protein
MFVAPLMLGGAKAKTAVEGMGVAEIAGAGRALAIEAERLEDDVLIVARFKEWGGVHRARSRQGSNPCAARRSPRGGDAARH